jgi:hypothetical protein
VEAYGDVEGHGKVNVGLKSIIRGDAGGEFGGKLEGGFSGTVEKDKDNLKEAAEFLKNSDSRPYWEHLEKIAALHGVNPLNEE